MTIKFTKKRAPGGLCWLCDRKLHAGGRAYVMVMIDGVERPAHDFCAGSAAIKTSAVKP